MRKLMIATVVTAGLALAACGGRGDDALGDNVASSAENTADRLEMQADNLEAQADQLEDRADAVRDEGERKEEAIDDADVDTRGLNAQGKAELANRM